MLTATRLAAAFCPAMWTAEDIVLHVRVRDARTRLQHQIPQMLVVFPVNFLPATFVRTKRLISGHTPLPFLFFKKIRDSFAGFWFKFIILALI
jgi:hypothetical protein